MSAWASGNMAARLKARQGAEKEPKESKEVPQATQAATETPAPAAPTPVAAAPAPAADTKSVAQPQQAVKAPSQAHQRTPKTTPAAPAGEYATLRHVSMPADLAALVSSEFNFVCQPAPPQTVDRAVVPEQATLAPTPVDPVPVHSSSVPAPYVMPRQHHHHQSHHPAPYHGNPAVNYFAPQQPMGMNMRYPQGYVGFGDIPRQYAMQQQMSQHYNAASYYPRQGVYPGGYVGYNPYGNPMGPGRLQPQPAYYPPREQ